MPWQRWALLHALELADDGTFRFRTVLVLCARQQGETTLMQVLALWRQYVDRAGLVIGTTQDVNMAEETWDGAVSMARVCRTWQPRSTTSHGSTTASSCA